MAPVGHRHYFLLQPGPLERPQFRFLQAGFKSAEDFLKQKHTPKFGEDIGIDEVNGSSEYAPELECLRERTCGRRTWPTHKCMSSGVPREKSGAMGAEVEHCFFCEHGCRCDVY